MTTYPVSAGDVLIDNNAQYSMNDVFRVVLSLPFFFTALWSVRRLTTLNSPWCGRRSSVVGRTEEARGIETAVAIDRERRKERKMNRHRIGERRKGDEMSEKGTRGRPRERWEERQMNRETKGHMRTARRGDCPAVGDSNVGVAGRGKPERGGVANAVLSNRATAL